MKMNNSKWIDVLNIINGKNQKKVENANGKYPIYGSGGIIGYADDYICPENTVIIGRKGSINNPIYVSEKFWNVDTAFGLIANQELLYPKYLYYFCKRFNFNRLNTTVTIPSLTKKKLQNIKIPLPETLDDQIKIANLLTQVESLIAKREESIKLLDALLRSTFLDMFGDPVLNEKGWDSVLISECCIDIVDCINKTAPTVDYETPYKMIRTTNVRNHKVTLEETRRVDKKTFEKWTRRLKPRRNDIVFTREAPIGEAGIILSDDEVFLGQRTMMYRTNMDIVNPQYLLYELMGTSVQQQISKISTGSTVKHLSVPNCKKFKINLPPKPLQDKFATIVQQVEESKEQYQKSLDELRELFGSLSQRAFRGELDLSKMKLDKAKLSSITINGNKVDLEKRRDFQLKEMKSTFYGLIHPNITTTLGTITNSNLLDNWKKEKEKLQKLALLASGNGSILNITKEYESILKPPSFLADLNISSMQDSIKALNFQTIESMGLQPLEIALGINHSYKKALEQAAGLTSLYDQSEDYQRIIDRYLGKVDIATEIMESISNLSELIDDEMFDELLLDSDYDTIKNLVFQLIDDGKLLQEFDKDEEKIVLKKVEA